MFDIREKPKLVEQALLVGAYFQRHEEAESADLLRELHELVETLGVGIVASELVFVRDDNQRYLTGSGKAKELMAQAVALGCDCIIFDNSLGPAQQRAWEEESQLTCFDREEVILDIFAVRARSREARLQVELARLQYALPRLKRMWGHLDRQGGGGGSGGGGASRGEGEQQIEVDRRLARGKLDRVRREIEVVRQQRATQRKERLRNPLPHAALVGYTNAGKSSVLNRLAHANVLEANKLFATLDPTTRSLEMPDGQLMLLTDTVGFVRRLPHRLVEAFKSTLEESILADFLIHVADAAQPGLDKRLETTMEVLAELGGGDKPMLLVLNKMDLVDGERSRELMQRFPDAVFVSLLTGAGLDELRERINNMMRDKVSRMRLRVPQSRAVVISQIHEVGKVLDQGYDGNDILVEAIIPLAAAHLFAGYQMDEG